MSLRPSFAGFDLNEMKALFGSGETEAIESLTELYAQLTNDDEELEQAEQIFKSIFMGDVLQNPPVTENETFQNVMACIAHSQELNYSASLFWEAFLVDITENQARYTEGPEHLLRYLLDGRPLFGKSIDSPWSYYAYFTNSEARELFAFIRSQEQFRREYDFEQAEFWMNEIERNGADVWFYAS